MPFALKHCKALKSSKLVNLVASVRERSSARKPANSNTFYQYVQGFCRVFCHNLLTPLLISREESEVTKFFQSIKCVTRTLIFTSFKYILTQLLKRSLNILLKGSYIAPTCATQNTSLPNKALLQLELGVDGRVVFRRTDIAPTAFQGDAFSGMAALDHGSNGIGQFILAAR